MRYFASVIVACLLASSAPGQPGTLKQFIPGNGAMFSNFGHSVAVDADWMAIGAPRESQPGSEGAVYLYRKGPTGWMPFTVGGPTFIGATPTSRFGISVAIEVYGPSAATLAVGASFETVGTTVQAGAVYLYDWDGLTWTQNTASPLTALPVVFDELFGAALDLQGDTLVVGASNGSPAGGGAGERGSVYTFNRTLGTWAQAGLLHDPAGNMFDAYGADVWLDYPFLVVGAPHANPNNINDAGKVYIYKNNGSGWIFTPAAVLPGPSQVGAYFGTAVALEGQRLIVGAHGVGPANNGIAYVFDEQTNGTWVQSDVLDPQSVAGAEFGVDIAIHDGLVVIGAYMAEEVRAYREVGGSWYSPFGPLTPPSPSNDYGISVALSDDCLAIGARLMGAQQQGGVYLYDVDPFFPTYGEGCVSNCGFVPILEAAGQPVSGGTITFFVRNSPSALNAFWFFGSGTGMAPLNSFCKIDVLPLLPFGPLPLFLPDGGSCQFGLTFSVNVSAPGLPPGVAVTTQVLISDPMAPGGIAKTNAVKIQL